MNIFCNIFSRKFKTILLGVQDEPVGLSWSPSVGGSAPPTAVVGSSGFCLCRCSSSSASLDFICAVACRRQLCRILFAPLLVVVSSAGFRLCRCSSSPAPPDFVCAVDRRRRLRRISFALLIAVAGLCVDAPAVCDVFLTSECRISPVLPFSSAEKIPKNGMSKPPGRTQTV